MKDEIGFRMKHHYERATQFYLPQKSFYIIRIDGNNFHSYTRHLDKPIDALLNELLNRVMVDVFKKVHGAIFAYRQSDEISIVFTDLGRIQSQLFYDGKIQKIASLTASWATQSFATHMVEDFEFADGVEALVYYDNDTQGDVHDFTSFPSFDSRVFTIPTLEEVVNYFLWRQQDARRNWIAMFCQANWSHKKLEGFNSKQQIEMLDEKGINWQLPMWLGTLVYKNQCDRAINAFDFHTRTSQRNNFILQDILSQYIYLDEQEPEQEENNSIFCDLEFDDQDLEFSISEELYNERQEYKRILSIYHQKHPDDHLLECQGCGIKRASKETLLDHLQFGTVECIDAYKVK